MWYLDCFTDIDEVNRKFPVNTYCHASLEKLIYEIPKLLGKEKTGIKRISISKTSVAQNPMILR